MPCSSRSSRCCECVSVQYPALALLQLPYRLRRGGAEENARRGVTLSNKKKKKKKERKKRRRRKEREGGYSEWDRAHQQWMYSIHSSSFFHRGPSFWGTRFHFNTSLQKPFSMKAMSSLSLSLVRRNLSMLLARRRTFSQQSSHFKLIKINPIILASY